MDSGGSSSLQVGYTVYYATGEKRPIADCLIFYTDITAGDTETPDTPCDYQQLYEALQTEHKQLQARHESMITGAETAIQTAQDALSDALEVLNG